MKLLKNESGCRAVAEAKTCCASSRPITLSDICVQRRA